MKIEPWHDRTDKMICAPNKDLDQPGHPPSVIRVFAVRLKQHWVLSYPLSAQQRLTRLCGCPGWAQRSFCWFCHEVAQNASSSSLNMQHRYMSSHYFTLCIEPNMKSLSHASNIILRWDIYIHSLNWC